MTSHKILFLLAIIAVLLFTNEKCDSNSIQTFDVTGSWRVDSTHVVPRDTHTKFPTEAIKNDESRGVIYHFNRDSTFTVSSDSSGHGNYSLSTESNKNFLVFINPYMNIRTKMEIITNTPNKLTLKGDEGSFSVFIYYTKQ